MIVANPTHHKTMNLPNNHDVRANVPWPVYTAITARSARPGASNVRAPNQHASNLGALLISGVPFCTADTSALITSFLGLLEGDGSIQVNRCGPYVAYRIVIRLAYTPANHAMLSYLQQRLGVMRVHVSGSCVLLVEDHRQRLPRVMALIPRYGSRTTHRRRQYALFRHCFRAQLSLPQVRRLKARGLAWRGFATIVPYGVDLYLNSPVTPNWLCGFTEALGCFSFRACGNASFSISQKDGFELMRAVRSYFGATNTVRTTPIVVSIEIYRNDVLRRIVSYFDASHVVGLLGQKRVQLASFRRALDDRDERRRIASEARRNGRDERRRIASEARRNERRRARPARRCAAKPGVRCAQDVQLRPAMRTAVTPTDLPGTE